jgi:EAL domain-containing protein (putative c-di-GMP-specific phosphodiesterase class I)
MRSPPPKIDAALDLRTGCFAALIMMVSGLASQALSFSGLSFSLFWPPAGIAFALIWRYGTAVLPSVTLGIAIPTFIMVPGWGSVFVVIGETCGPWAGVSLLKVVARRTRMRSAPLRWQLSFYACGVLVACPIAALLGSVGALMEHRFAVGIAPGVFLAYIMVEAIGVVLFAPPLLDWFDRDLATPAADSQPTSRPWILLAPLAIESLRVLLFTKQSQDYADLLIYCYFPLVAWCALTAKPQRTNALLLIIAIAVLSDQAWRVNSAAAPSATFELFRFALVTFIITVMGQLLAALATERRLTFLELARQLELDTLTGLLNERSFTRALGSMQRPGKVVLLSFDNWPEFEILAGIGAGYDLQREVSDILRAAPDLSSPARLQAGTFACLLGDAIPWPGPLTPMLNRRWNRAGIEMRMLCSALTVPDCGATSEGDLLLGARTVLNQALVSAEESPLLRQWSPALVAERRAYEVLVDVIKHRVRAGRLHLYAQPITQAHADGKPSLEILVRIEGEDGQILPSADVVRVLSQSSVSTELDRSVIKATFDWFGLHREYLESVGRVAINLTGASLSAPTLFDWIETCRADAGLSADAFAFEITESQAILNVEAARSFVQRLREVGYRIALDDFGTGLATFDYLKRFPVDYIKIDGSFIRNLVDSPIDREIVNGIVRLARLMNIKTVAEYVSDSAIARAAVYAGVDALQGYAIQCPLPLIHALEWCREQEGFEYSERRLRSNG